MQRICVGGEICTSPNLHLSIIHLQPKLTLNPNPASPQLSYRKTYIPHFPPHLVTIKFILGLPAPVEHYNPAAAIARAKVMRAIEEESEKEGDMVILDVSRSLQWSVGMEEEGVDWVWGVVDGR